ncbi:MAG: hypothetical protein IJR03_00805 [Bacteroidales bacterium]|nr:hypothetical protein [Bacteroidales bacterium]
MVKIIRIIACWVAYLLFAAYSAYMTSKSISMSFEIDKVWAVFVFVMVVSILAGLLLKMLISEFKNTINPSKSRIVLCLLGFLLFWGASFTTNVHYMLMQNKGLTIVKNELGNYKNFIESKTSGTTIKTQEQEDIINLSNTLNGYLNQFNNEMASSIREGFGDRAKNYLKQIETYFQTSAERYGDTYKYENSIFDEEKDRGDIGIKGSTRCAALFHKYSTRVIDKQHIRERNIKSFYERERQKQFKEYPLFKEYIDTLFAVDIPKLEKIKDPEVYYIFQREPLSTIYSKLDNEDKQEIAVTLIDTTNSSKADIEKGDFRYIVYPSSRMFSTFNVWSDMLNGRLPSDMKLFGWILFALIIDIVTFIIRMFC